MFKSLRGKLNTLTPPIIAKAIKLWHFLCSRIKPRKVGGLNKPINKPPYEYWIKKQFIFILLFLFIPSCQPAFAYTDNQICEAIGKAENSVKYPYGIKSIDTHGDKDYARKICLNTIGNNRKRFANQTKYKDYIEFLGSRYCPPKAHKLNRNWVKNVKFYLKQCEN